MGNDNLTTPRSQEINPPVKLPVVVCAYVEELHAELTSKTSHATVACDCYATVVKLPQPYAIMV